MPLPRLTAAVEQLAAAPLAGYAASGPPSVEPTAAVALALLRHDRAADARPALQWIVRCQQDNGAVAPRPGMPGPHWTSGPAMTVWTIAARYGLDEFLPHAAAARQWSVEHYGEALELPAARRPLLGHDVRLRGWPWVQGTHSWVEPTCWQVLGLAAAGGAAPADAVRERLDEACQLLLDRQLLQGGWNYGNTSVLGQTLRPHLQPTALALLALRRLLPPSTPEYVGRSLSWLRRELARPCGGCSQAWARLAIRAWDGEAAVPPAEARRGDPPPILDSPLRAALELLAAAPHPDVFAPETPSLPASRPS